MAYQPWIEALDMLVDAVAPEVLADHVAVRGASVARLVPRLAARVGIEPPEGPVGDAERYVLFGAVTDLLTRATATDPVVLVVDDLHWSDRQSLQLLRHVVTAGEPMRLLIIGTFRDSEVQAGDPLSELLAVFHREDGVDRLALGGLGDADLLEFLERAAGHEMDEAGIGLRDAVLAETAGNPFFVGEILRHLRDSGAITQDGGRWVGTVDLAEVGLPVSVTEVVGRRIGVLGDETRKVLAAGAVMGRDFDIDIVAQVTGVDEDTVIDLCDAAVDASVLTTTDRVGVYSFAHALIGHTLVQGLSATRRARMHRAVADAIEASGDPETRAGELANHWANAVHVDADKVVTYEVLAGRQALAQLAPDVAVDWFTRALEHHGTGGVDEARRVEILIGLGEAQKQSGLGDFRATLLEAAAIADRLGLADELARAVMLNSRQHHSNIDGVDSERVHFIERALETTITDEDRALLLALLATERLNVTAVEARLELVDQALACSADAPPAVRAAVLLRACRAAPGPSAVERRIGWVEAARPLVELIDDPHLALECAFMDVSLGLVQGDAASMHQGVEVVGEILERVQEATRRWAHRYSLATVAVIDGDLDRAEAIAEDALQLGLAAEQADAFSLYGAQILGIRNQQGRIEEMIPLLEDIVAQQPDRTVYLATLAMACAETGDTARAQDLVDACRDKGFSGLWDLDYTIGLAALAKAILILGDTTSAKALRPLLVEYPEQIATTQVSVSCALAYWLGRIDHLLGDVDSAEHWLTVADRIHRRFESPLLTAYSDVAIAALLADRGRPTEAERARQLAEAALEVASTRGYVPVARDARAVLDRL